MARPSAAAAAALLLLLLSLLAVANCRPHEARPAIATDAEPSSAAVAAAGDVDDDVNSPVNITLPAEAEQQQRGFLRLPSHLQRRHHPCRHGPFHRHLWWAPRHDHGAFGDDAPRRFHHHRHHVEALRRLPADETREAGEVKAVAEPDTDRSMIADSDGERERAVAASMEPSFGDAAYGGAGEQAAHEAGDGAAAVRAWKREMLRRWVQFHHHRHGEDDDEEKDMMTRKKFRHGDDHDDDSDGDSDDDEVEEMVRRFRKAIMRRRFGGHGRRRRRFHHHHHYGHRHGEEAEEGGVVSWIKGLANWF